MLWPFHPASFSALKPAFACKVAAALTLILTIMSPAAWAQSRVQIAVKDSLGKPIANSVIMVQPDDGATLPSRLSRRDFAVQQIDREFVPKITIAALGSRVTFPNRDVVQHSVYSFSKAKPFEIPIYAGDSPQVITLDKAGVVTLGCNIHDWMVGYIVVADTPIAETTKADGMVTIADLPRGKYTLRVWHSQLVPGEITQQFSLTESESRVDVSLPLKPARERYKPPLNIKGY
jgi:plastocyanin